MWIFFIFIIYLSGDYVNRKYDKEFIICLLIPLMVGLVSGLISRGGIINYESLNMPSFAPPRFVFPLVWTILYILMGISSYLIYDSNNYRKTCCLVIYGLSLFLNFLWSPIFFGLELRLFALIWIILLDIVIIYMIWCFYGVNKKAAYLQIPYLLWCLFATFLNYSIYILNR